MKSLTAQELYNLADIEPSGTTQWSQKVPSKASGVYVVSVDKIDAITFIEPFEEVERANWRADQEIVYIGRATVLATRLRQFERHIYGQRSPHRGGQAILLLRCAKTITWAELDDFCGAEDRLIKAFQSYAGRMPFGNRVHSAKKKSDATRFVANKDDIKPLGKFLRTVNLLTPEEEAESREHDAMVASLYPKFSD